MDKNEIVNNLVEYISDVENRKGELTLFTWGHSLRCKISDEYGIEGDINRILSIEAYNRTHPHSIYTINPLTLDDETLTFESL